MKTKKTLKGNIERVSVASEDKRPWEKRHAAITSPRL